MCDLCWNLQYDHVLILTLYSSPCNGEVDLDPGGGGGT